MTGYKSKRAAAQDKLEQDAFDAWWDTQPRLNETNPCIIDSFEYWAWEGWHAALAQPAQERNFCPRCGKRTADLNIIHTCTPPQEKQT